MKDHNRKALKGRRAESRLLSVALAVCVLFSAPPTPLQAETLRQALAAAYRYNPRLEAERARLRATDENVNQAIAGYRPRLSGSADIGVNDTNSDFSGTRGAFGASGSGTVHPKSYSFSLSQNIFNGFQTTNTVREAEAGVRAGRETLRDVERAVLLEAVSAFMNVIRDQAVVRLQENNVNVLLRERRATEDRFKVGEVTRTDVAQAKARWARSVSSLDLARANLKTSRANYERVIGAPPNRLVEASAPLGRIPRTLQAAIAKAEQENPLLVAALYREQAARHTVDRIRGELLPQVDLEASYRERFDSSVGVDRTESAEVTGRLSVPIYQGGQVYSRVRAAKQTHISLLSEIERFRTEVRESVVSAWSQLQASRAQLRSDQIQVQANQTALNGVREEEKVGQRTLLDVLDAEQELLNAQVSHVTTKRDLVVNAYSLLSAVGSLEVASLGVAGTVYDAEEHYHEVRRKWWGLSITHEDGRREDVDLWSTHGERESYK